MPKKQAQKKNKEKNMKKNNSKDINKLIISKLKNFQELKSEYELIDTEILTFRIILEHQQDLLDIYEDIILQLLQPEKFHSLFESNYFSEREKSEFMEHYKIIMILNREIAKAQIKNDEKDCIATIQYVHEELKKIKPHILKLLTKLGDCWKTDVKKIKQGYFG